jgi:hypothetical protein
LIFLCYPVTMLYKRIRSGRAPLVLCKLKLYLIFFTLGRVELSVRGRRWLAAMRKPIFICYHFIKTLIELFNNPAGSNLRSDGLTQGAFFLYSNRQDLEYPGR